MPFLKRQNTRLFFAVVYSPHGEAAFGVVVLPLASSKTRRLFIDVENQRNERRYVRIDEVGSEQRLGSVFVLRPRRASCHHVESAAAYIPGSVYCSLRLTYHSSESTAVESIAPTLSHFGVGACSALTAVPPWMLSLQAKRIAP